MIQQLKYAKFDTSTNILSSSLPPVEFDEIHFADFALKYFKIHGEKKFFTDSKTGQSMTFEQVKDVSAQLASSFINFLSLETRDVVFGFAPNSCIFGCTVFASIFAGLIYTGCSWNLIPSDLAHQVNDSKAKLIFCIKKNLSTVLSVLKQCSSIKTVVLLDEFDVPQNWPSDVKIMSFDELVSHGKANDPKIPRTDGLDVKECIGFLHYSSGSTGHPKGVKRSGYSLIGQSYNIRETRTFFGLSDDVTSCFQSFAHASGAMTLTLTLLNGSEVVIIDDLTPENLFSAISNYKVTVSLLPPTILQVLAKMDIPDHYDLSSLKVISTGGASLPFSIVNPFLSKFKGLKKLSNIYGMTEAGVPIGTPEDCFDYKALGAPYRGTQVKIVHQTNGKTLSFNETGEIYVKSIQNASGYLNRTEVEAGTFTSDGWVRTGDAGYFDENGLIYYVERLKEMIKVHMFQVAPAELESILCSHPSVSAACVVATSHATTGETPRAFVVPKNVNNPPDEQELLQFVNKQLVDFKRINGGIFLVSSLPKISIGKFNRKMLKNEPSKLSFLKPQSISLLKV